jgi:hypothetical protein
MMARVAPLSQLKSALLFVALCFSLGCAVDKTESGIPSEAQTAIDTFTADFNAGRFEKIYREASDEWRTQVSLEQSAETFRRLRERLGTIKQERTYTGGRQQQTATANLPADSLVLRYNTKFRREDGAESDGMETFTLIKRDGRYMLAGYAVSSDVLK